MGNIGNPRRRIEVLPDEEPARAAQQVPAPAAPTPSAPAEPAREPGGADQAQPGDGGHGGGPDCLRRAPARRRGTGRSGSVRALRTFRLGPDGRLFPLYDDRP